jgi:NADPH:quinone reductase
MRALRFRQTGTIDALKLEDVDDPLPGEGELLIRVRAASINPSDFKNVLGKMSQTTLPRVPGRDFAGVVEAGPEEWLGQEVFGTGDGLGFTRDGTHAQYVVVPEGAVLTRPAFLPPEQAAAIGVGFLTAWAGVATTARLREGETLLVTGVTGVVGGAAAQVGKARGAMVLGTFRGKPRSDAHPCFVDTWINIDEASVPASVMEATAGHGADVVFDVVGGPLFEPCLESLAHGGRYVVIASAESPRVSFDLVDFYRREGRLFGLDTLSLSFEESRDILRSLLPGIAQRKLVPPPVQKVSLLEAPEAYRALAGGRGALAKYVIVDPR